MLKIRITFIDNDRGNNELVGAIETFKSNYNVLGISKVYKGRGKSQYSNVYIDVEEEKSNEQGNI